VKNAKMIFPILALGILLGGAGVYSIKYASAYNGANQVKMSEELAAKLNVSTDKVDAAMGQIHEERQAERKAEISANLDKAVSDGVITAEQKQKILDKQAQNEQEREQKKAEMEKWAADNGIDFSKLKTYGFGMGGRGHKGAQN
jgi:hypothetical protein